MLLRSVSGPSPGYAGPLVPRVTGPSQQNTAVRVNVPRERAGAAEELAKLREIDVARSARKRLTTIAVAGQHPSCSRAARFNRMQVADIFVDQCPRSSPGMVVPGLIVEQFRGYQSAFGRHEYASLSGCLALPS